MNTLPVSPSFLQRLQYALSDWTKPAAVQPLAPEAGDDTRDRMSFIADMMQGNGNAFASDIDVQGMMNLYPDRF